MCGYLITVVVKSEPADELVGMYQITDHHVGHICKSNSILCCSSSIVLLILKTNRLRIFNTKNLIQAE